MAVNESPEDRARWNAAYAAKRTARYQWLRDFTVGLGIEFDELTKRDPVEFGLMLREHV